MKVISILLIVIGFLMAVTGSFSFREKKKLLDTDVVDISRSETKTIAWPCIAGIVVVVGGVAMLFLGGRRNNG